MAKRNFVILIGGPGKFEPCDKEHDHTWSNYIVPIQVASKKKQIEASKHEQIHWWVYAPAYRERWSADVSAVDTADADKKFDRGRNIIDSRKKAIDKIKSSGADDYLDRIRKFSGTVGAQFRAIESPADFWKQLGALPDGSVSRLWYIGHASGKMLMLKLIHYDNPDEKCVAGAAPEDQITIEDIATNQAVITKKLAANGRPSKFYGCHTKAFAEKWNNLFGAAAEGAIAKIDFGLVDQESDIPQVLPRLEAGSDWKSYDKTKAVGP